jgi:tetratricopeptide (TPR) repeat protein
MQAYLDDESCVNAIYNLGVIYYEKGDIAHCYYKLKDYERAIEWAEKVLALSPDHLYAAKMLS